MTVTGKKKGLKSLGAGKPMRSRGFLSQPGGRAAPGTAQDKAARDPENQKSRGARQVSISADGKPQTLSPRPSIKPYRLEDT